MANLNGMTGTITLSFESPADLEEQLKGLLAMGRTPNADKIEAAQTALKRVGAVHLAGNGSVAELKKAVEAKHMTIEPSKQETAKPVVEVKDEKDKPAETSVEKKPEETSGITKENLKTVPYEELLAFCEAHPEVGINPEKVKQTIMRGLVELKVGNYLDAQ